MKPYYQDTNSGIYHVINCDAWTQPNELAGIARARQDKTYRNSNPDPSPASSNRLTTSRSASDGVLSTTPGWVTRQLPRTDGSALNPESQPWSAVGAESRRPSVTIVMGTRPTMPGRTSPCSADAATWQRTVG